MAYPADPIVLDFPTGSSQHVYHGYFWPTSADLGKFFWEAWLMPRTGAEYWLSEGYGGAHALLAGFGGLVPTGNMSSDGSSTTTSYTGDYTAKTGEWLHYSVGWDSSYIYCRINGVVVARAAHSAARRAQQGTLFVGGSDHSNFDGRIAMVRGFEDVYPLPSSLESMAIRPERPFGPNAQPSGVVIPASFLATYMGDGLQIYDDLGKGYDGIRHPGSLWGGGTKNLGMGTVEAFGYPLPTPTVDTTAPFGYTSMTLPDEAIPSAPATPGSAKIFDSFSRRNQTYAFQSSPTLGDTEAGSLGAKTWQGTDVFGILQGRAVYLGTFYAHKWVVSDSADMDVRVDRRKNTTAGLVGDTGLSFRVQDINNYWVAFTQVSVPRVRLAKTSTGPGGIATVVDWSLPNDTWTTMRIVTSGNTITGYIDNGAGGWTQIGTTTDATLNTATGAGIYSNYNDFSLKRWDNFTVL